ncbi:glycine--tRNA ligase subunit beta [Desulfocurvus sp.]|uniref:glycine--tRNA ligase subunit beta n=1 Tax=Desulfocurvus sp. TaxID=2871698 RepID=UPI0025BEA4B6|nr:glycine--tRNA ligase subunit beta [Desulfocurvus sp.]MCK9240412.1 glycine--tRNA ligase subunit beta [Desulfocurvus sp.]
MPEFILEIGTEELPARFFPRLHEELGEAVAKALEERLVDFSGLRTFATPRRVVLHVAEVAPAQRREEELLTGPPRRIAYDAEGAPTKAALGFAKTQGVDIADCFIQTTDKGEYLAVRRMTGGEATLGLLPAVCEAAVAGLQFPKKMRWGAREFGFGRPIQWLLALFGAEVVPFALAGVASGRSTRGHRVLGPGPFEVAEAGRYFEIVRESGRVILDPAERRTMIRERADALAREAGGRVVWKEDLLDEVVGLVEAPLPVLGDFDPSFLEVPREVLLTSMESHQKSFGVEDAQGALLAHFVTTLNLEPRDPALVKKGWERVLRARLEDARFFWKADLRADADAWLGRLDKVIFLAPLGTVGDKTRRLEGTCAALAGAVAPELRAVAARAGRLSKADLVSEMVYEFDELQGVMGGIYARRRGEPEAVADALYEQYLPAGPGSPVPQSLAGALLSVADKADTLAGCFGLDMIPTGANDPYALRRAALGIIRIILHHGLRLSLGELLARARGAYADGVAWKLPEAEAQARLLEFFAGRLKAYFTARGHQTLVVEAALGAGFDDVWALAARVDALGEFAREDDFAQAVLTFKRAANIIVKQGGAAAVDGGYDKALLAERAEQALAARLEAVAPVWDELWARDDFASLLGLLRELRPDVDAFFDGVMVMCDDAALRANRLNLLGALVGRLGRLADFAALQV